ncbi:transaldolase [Pandoraea sputorum]|uniref:Transaldolase n=1 Tax=Pandoraea sputorum TaxID=93222 RepID=A0A5E5BB50_9BURK|nr:transaldolase [Pandoraea sputorum]VVE82538.1 Transaldolase [Pandoraea sputorum]
MNATLKLKALGQSLWLDDFTRGLLEDGTLARYRDKYHVTGLTSNPSIFLKAIRDTAAYDIDIAKADAPGLSDESLFFSLALKDLTQAAELFLPAHRRSKGVDGWVSLEVSPRLTEDAVGTVAAAKTLHVSAHCPNLFIKIPGTTIGIVAIEEAIFAGVPVNVTLLFSREQYVEAANAYWRGLVRRRDAGLDLRVASVASLFISRWDTAVTGEVPFGLRYRLGVAVAKQTYGAYRERMLHPMWRELSEAGASPQRLLWASTGVKSPELSPSYYVEALAAPDTIDTVPEGTLLSFATRGELISVMREDGGNADPVLADFAHAGIDVAALAARLQREGVDAFRQAWAELMQVIAGKRMPERLLNSAAGRKP